MCGTECLPCWYFGSDWECGCPKDSFVHPAVLCVDKCPTGYVSTPEGVCSMDMEDNSFYSASA